MLSPIPTNQFLALVLRRNSSNIFLPSCVDLVKTQTEHFWLCEEEWQWCAGAFYIVLRSIWQWMWRFLLLWTAAGWALPQGNISCAHIFCEIGFFIFVMVGNTYRYMTHTHTIWPIPFPGEMYCRTHTLSSLDSF